MGCGFKAAAGGGSGLSFSVKAYAAEEELLAAAPRENTIGVVTDTAVPKWGFSAAEPEAPAEGEVCFLVGTESGAAFNALKKNTLTVYPVSCKQYISGAWAGKVAYIYKGGAWVQFSSEWNGELFVQGNTYDAVTGGWKTNLCTVGTSIENTSFKRGIVYACTKNKIDITDFNTLYLTGYCYGENSAGGDGFRFGLTNSLGPANTEDFVLRGRVDGEANGVGLDISKQTGSYYIAAMADWTYYNEGTFRIDKFWME